MQDFVVMKRKKGWRVDGGKHLLHAFPVKLWLIFCFRCDCLCLNSVSRKLLGPNIWFSWIWFWLLDLGSFLAVSGKGAVVTTGELSVSLNKPKTCQQLPGVWYRGTFHCVAPQPCFFLLFSLFRNLLVFFFLLLSVFSLPQHSYHQLLHEILMVNYIM